MCDFTGKLTSWLDGELLADAAADVERHLQLCAECRARVESYREVSGAFDAYCDAYCDRVTAARRRHKLPRRLLVASGAAAVAAAVATLLLVAPRARVQLSPAGAPAPVETAAVVSQRAAQTQAAQPTTAVVKTVHRIERNKAAQQVRHAAPQVQAQDGNMFLAGPAVEIAIPADAIFPPGAIPEGVGFTADVTIAPDGSAQQIRLRPQLTEFERRSTRP
jgi:hypothetical protein